MKRRNLTSYDLEKLEILHDRLGTWQKVADRLKVSVSTVYYWRRRKKKGHEVQPHGKIVKRVRNLYQYETRTKPKKSSESLINKYPVLQYYASDSTIRNNLENTTNNLYLSEVINYHKKQPEGRIAYFMWFVQFEMDIYSIDDVDGETVYSLVEEKAKRRLSLLTENNLGGQSIPYIDKYFDLLVEKLIKQMQKYTYYENAVARNISIDFIWSKDFISKKKGVIENG